MSLQRPASITDAFLEKLVARVPSTSGGTWKLTEVYTGEVLVELPQSTPEDVERAYATAREAAYALSTSTGVDCGSSTSTSPV